MKHSEIIARYAISAKKSLGQNFLVNDTLLERISEIVPITWQNILEIGPGYGALTGHILAKSPASLHLIELDPKMISILEDRLQEKILIIPDGTDFQIHHTDVLKFVPTSPVIPAEAGISFGSAQKEKDPLSLRGEMAGISLSLPDKGGAEVRGGGFHEESSEPPASPLSGGQSGTISSNPPTPDREGVTRSSLSNTSYSIIANIPYYITSPILFRFLYELEYRPDYLVILMQKEVGDKIRATKQYGNSYLSLAMEYACESIEESMPVARGNFIPPPKIESVVLRFHRRQNLDKADADRFLQIISAGFVAPRKKLLSNLSGKLGIDKTELLTVFATLGWSETVRAEALGLSEWKRLITALKETK